MELNLKLELATAMKIMNGLALLMNVSFPFVLTIKTAMEPLLEP